MGVPSFYRWLANRYPKTVVNAVETTDEHDGSSPNPNGIEFDNLYLDMNGIIHPCFHPEQDDQVNSPVTYDEVFDNIFEYIDRILNIVRPRKLLYMAIDGVAPRAKMNQQRSRRFRTAKDRQTLEEEEDRLRKQFEIEGKDVFPKVESRVADSNVITPGTEFMYELSKQLQSYIRLRIANHPAWRSLRVILSDASSPGEGEHKIMSFIRRQRTCEGYDPNTRHVLYGLDADLIMLALATHEIHFSILRENVLVEPTAATPPSKAKFDSSRGLDDTAEQISRLDISEVSKKKTLLKKPYQFLHVWILREYLKLDLKITEMPEKFVPDVERLIDDFIFICFFAGNDFLPHMPTLEIHEGAIDLLMHVYTEEFKNLGGYLVDVQRINERKGAYIKLKRVEKFILAVGAYEDRIFKKRSAIYESRLRRILSDIQADEGHEEDLFPVMSSTSNQKDVNHDMQISENTKMLKEQLKSYTREKSDVFKNGLVTDKVKFGSPGWRKRYYKCKFSVETDEDMEKIRKNLVEKYTQGLCWVLLYYFSDVPSWTWYYPYHYGPFASDFKGLSSNKVIFTKGLPFKPFDQLMAVLPPTSAHALPAQYRLLMTDEESSILDYYPSDFDTDTDGKRFIWQGICKLPFIDEDRLLSATKKIEKDLSAEEAKRNMENLDQLFVHSSENLASRILSSFNDVGLIKQGGNSIKIDSDPSCSISGLVQPKLDSVNDPDVLCVYYELPCFSPHIPRVLAGSTFPETDVSEVDIEERQLWHDMYGYNNSRNYRSHNRSEGSDGNPNAGFRNSSPNVVNIGAGSGWNPRGRGRVHNSPHSGSYNGNPNTGFRNSCPNVVNIGAASGWNPRGRGEVHRSPHSGSYNGNPNTGFRNSCPNVVNIGGGSGWNPRGRGEVHRSPHGSYHDAVRTVDDQTRGQSWCANTYGRGTARGNASGHYGRGYHTMNRWGESQSRHDRGDANVGSWRRTN
ncbi:putative 5-3 exonuclease, 5'-3' exoribonuclease, xrn1, helical domain-containing protein [Helianthus annuus]|nr:putative 5-3 exonuclease, 5'-3' exoribonuclease, xrn1, helical domain-containing protein [Helianthus annuus]